MKKLFLTAVAVFAAVLGVNAQESVDSVAILEQQKIDSYNETVQQRMTYDRSSLAVAMILHTEDEFGQDIRVAFEAMPFPDKYDNHDVGLRVIDNAAITGVAKKQNGLIKARYGKKLNANDVQKNADALLGILNDAHVANYMIAKWFGLYESDVCNMNLIKERGQYNATELDVAIAKQSVRGLSMLSDAGEMLIANTYLLINDMTYVTAEERAAAAKGVMSVVGELADVIFGTSIFSDLAETGSAIADSFTGFSVKNHSYLFRLNWNDEIAAIFYNEYYMTEPNPTLLDKFLKDERFSLSYVAHEYEFGEKNAVKGKYDRHDLVKMVCTRSIDKNIAALQLQYEDFKVKTPIHEVVLNQKGKVQGYAVKIGLKEGITEKSSFQVVCKEVDPETNKTTYRYVATVKPVRGHLWDNRYMAAEEKDAGSELTYTLLKKTSGGEILPGMLVIEGKYSKIKY